MTESEFTEKWAPRLLWLGQRGLAFDADEPDPRPKGPFAAHKYAYSLPDKIKRMVHAILADAAGVHAPAQPKEKR